MSLSFFSLHIYLNVSTSGNISYDAKSITNNNSLPINNPWYFKVKTRNWIIAHHLENKCPIQSNVLIFYPLHFFRFSATCKFPILFPILAHDCVFTHCNIVRLESSSFLWCGAIFCCPCSVVQYDSIYLIILCGSWLGLANSSLGESLPRMWEALSLMPPYDQVKQNKTKTKTSQSLHYEEAGTVCLSL